MPQSDGFRYLRGSLDQFPILYDEQTLDIDSIYKVLNKHYPNLITEDHITFDSEDWADALSDLNASIEALKGLTGEAEKDQLIRIRTKCLNVIQVMENVVEFVDRSIVEDPN